MSCSVGHRPCSDPALLWLWHRPAATALIRPLAWEPPYAPGAALEKAKRQKTKNKKQKYAKPEAWSPEGCADYSWIREWGQVLGMPYK